MDASVTSNHKGSAAAFRGPWRAPVSRDCKAGRAGGRFLVTKGARRLARPLFLFILLRGLGTAVTSTAKADELDADEARALRESGAILPLEDILERARAVRPGRVIEIELEREDRGIVYDLEVLDPEGQIWEIELDAASGRILEQERED
jgi:hypothetical protein